MKEKNPFGFGKVKRIKLGGKMTTVIVPDKHISIEESTKRMRELQKIHGRNRSKH